MKENGTTERRERWTCDKYIAAMGVDIPTNRNCVYIFGLTGDFKSGGIGPGSSKTLSKYIFPFPHVCSPCSWAVVDHTTLCWVSPALNSTSTDIYSLKIITLLCNYGEPGAPLDRLGSDIHISTMSSPRHLPLIFPVDHLLYIFGGGGGSHSWAEVFDVESRRVERMEMSVGVPQELEEADEETFLWGVASTEVVVMVDMRRGDVYEVHLLRKEWRRFVSQGGGGGGGLGFRIRGLGVGWGGSGLVWLDVDTTRVVVFDFQRKVWFGSTRGVCDGIVNGLHCLGCVEGSEFSLVCSQLCCLAQASGGGGGGGGGSGSRILCKRVRLGASGGGVWVDVMGLEGAFVASPFQIQCVRIFGVCH